MRLSKTEWTYLPTCHKKATAIQVHGEDAPNASEMNWAKNYPNFDLCKNVWQDALNGNLPDEVTLLGNKLVRNAPRPLVHHLVAEYDDALHLTTSTVEEHWKEVTHDM